MRKDQTDMIWNMTVLLLGALVLLAGGRLLFFAFGFQSDRPWQFVLFLLIFLVLEELFSLFKSRFFPLLLRLFRPEGFLQLILCRSMAETLMVLGILLLLRHLPGIHIGSFGLHLCPILGRHRFDHAAVGRMEATKPRIGNPNQI